jgi:hypothetical protein
LLCIQINLKKNNNQMVSHTHTLLAPNPVHAHRWLFMGKRRQIQSFDSGHVDLHFWLFSIYSPALRSNLAANQPLSSLDFCQAKERHSQAFYAHCHSGKILSYLSIAY